MNEWMNEWSTEVFIEQALASPGSANYPVVGPICPALHLLADIVNGVHWHVHTVTAVHQSAQIVTGVH